MAFTLRQLQYFVAVADQGTVTGAARVLSISQSAITESLKDLEADLGLILFERHSRGLNITHQGHQFLRHATRILGSVSDARRALTETEPHPADQLHIGVTPLVAGYVFSDILSRYRRAQSMVDVTAIEDDGDYLEHLLVGGELDAAVMLTSNLKDHTALQTETLEVSPYQVWLPAGHRLAAESTVDPVDLSSERLIMLRIDEIEETTSGLLSKFGARFDVAFRTQSVEAVRSLVATGAGIAFLPDLVYRPWSLEGDRIEARPVLGGLPMVEVGIAWRRGSRPSGATREFIAIARAHSLSRRA